MLNNNYNDNNHNNNYYYNDSNSYSIIITETEKETETNNNKRTRTINNTTTLLLCYLLFTMSFFCLSSSSVVYAIESKNCITKKDGKIVYNVSDGDNECAVLYNIGDLKEGIGIVNTVDENLETNLTGTPCEFNSDTDSHMDSYRDGIVSQNTRILNGSSITLSCKAGYSLNNADKNKIYCSEGTLSYEFDGCYYTGNKGSSLQDALTGLFGNGNNNTETYTVSPNGEILTSAGTVLKDSNGNTIDQQYLMDRGYSINDNGGIVDSNGNIVEEFSNSNNGNNNNNNSSFDISDLNIGEDMLSGDKDYTIGEPVVIACKEKEGYTLNPDKNSVVMTPLGNSKWDKQGECEYKPLCSAYTNYIQDSSLEYSREADNNGYYGDNTTVSIKCNEGYRFTGGDNKATCSSGVWNDNLTPDDYCEKMCVGYETTIANSIVSYDRETINNGNYYYDTGTKLSLSCKEEENYIGTISNNILICDKGNWSGNTPSGNCIKMCPEYKTNILGATVSYTTNVSKFNNKNYYNNETIATINANCSNNQYFDGNNTLTCSNGEWTGIVGSCKSDAGCFKAKSISINSITINYFIGGNNGTNNCIIDWGDGTIDTCDQTSNSHSYTTKGQYIVKICGSGFRGLKETTNGAYWAFLGSIDSSSNPWIQKLISYGNWNQITKMDYAFYANSNLNEVNNNAFDGLPNVTSFAGTFNSCTSLKQIPAGLFDKNTKVIDFGVTFSNSGLTTIPKGLFDNNPNVTSFYYTFNGTSIITVPNGIFDKNTKVTNFGNTFSRCLSLTSIPDGLFAKQNNVQYFHTTFGSSSSLKCSDIDGWGNEKAIVKNNWPKWNNTNMTAAKSGCLKNCQCSGDTTSGYWAVKGTTTRCDYNSPTMTQGTKVQLACNSGYTLFYSDSVSNPRVATCDNGTWVWNGGKNNQGDSCYKNCSTLTVTNGSVKLYSNTNKIHNSTATLQCNSGYILSGNATATCSNGSWTGGGSCVEKPCSKYSTNIIGATISFNKTASNNTYPVGTKATVVCANNYSGTISNNTLTCSKGAWSGTTPSGKCVIQVKYGMNSFNYKNFDVGSQVCCNNDTFGDPEVGVVKACWTYKGRVAEENGCFTAN